MIPISVESNSQPGCVVSGLHQLKLENDSLPRCVFIPVSDLDLLKPWRATYILNTYSAIIFGSADLLRHWRETHILDACSAIVFNGSDLLRYWRETHILNVYSALLLVTVVSNTEE